MAEPAARTSPLKRSRAGWPGDRRVVLVVCSRCHVVGGVGVEQRSEQLDLSAAHARRTDGVHDHHPYAASDTAGSAANCSEPAAAGRSLLTTVSPTAIAASTSTAPIRYAR